MSKTAVLVLISGVLLGGFYLSASTPLSNRSVASAQPEAVADTIPFEYVADASSVSHR